MPSKKKSPQKSRSPTSASGGFGHPSSSSSHHHSLEEDPRYKVGPGASKPEYNTFVSVLRPCWRGHWLTQHETEGQMFSSYNYFNETVRGADENYPVACCYSPDGEFIAELSSLGELSVRDATHAVLHKVINGAANQRYRYGQRSIRLQDSVCQFYGLQPLCWSGDSKLLFVGSNTQHSCEVEVLDVSKRFEQRGGPQIKEGIQILNLAYFAPRDELCVCLAVGTCSIWQDVSNDNKRKKVRSLVPNFNSFSSKGPINVFNALKAVYSPTRQVAGSSSPIVVCYGDPTKDKGSQFGIFDALSGNVIGFFPTFTFEGAFVCDFAISQRSPNVLISLENDSTIRFYQLWKEEKKNDDFLFSSNQYHAYQQQLLPFQKQQQYQQQQSNKNNNKNNSTSSSSSSSTSATSASGGAGGGLTFLGEGGNDSNKMIIESGTLINQIKLSRPPLRIALTPADKGNTFAVTYQYDESRLGTRQCDWLSVDFFDANTGRILASYPKNAALCIDGDPNVAKRRDIWCAGSPTNFGLLHAPVEKIKFTARRLIFLVRMKKCGGSAADSPLVTLFKEYYVPFQRVVLFIPY